MPEAHSGLNGKNSNKIIVDITHRPCRLDTMTPSQQTGLLLERPEAIRVSVLVLQQLGEAQI